MKINAGRFVLLLILAATAGAAIYFYFVPETAKEAKRQSASAAAPKDLKRQVTAPATPKDLERRPGPKDHAGDASTRGLNPIMILVEELPPAAASCGLGRDAIRIAAELSLSQSDLRVVKSAAGAKGYLYIQVNVLSMQNICAANIHVSFRTGSVVESNNQLTIASIWNENIIGAAWPNDAAREIISAVDTLTKKFIEKWTRDNRRETVKRES